MRLHFPYFPSEMEFTQALQSSISVCENTKEKFSVLTKFAMEYPRLKLGARLLPDLVKLYNWIHRELKCLVEESYAENNGLEEIITKGDKLFPDIDLCKLHQRVTGNKVILWVFFI